MFYKGLSGNSNAISNTYGVLCNTIIFFYKTVFLYDTPF